MIPAMNFAFTAWSLLISGGSFSTRASAAFQPRYDKMAHSYEKISDGQPAVKRASFFNEKPSTYYNAAIIHLGDSVVSSITSKPLSAPTLTDWSFRDGWTPVFQRQSVNEKPEKHSKMPMSGGSGGMRQRSRSLQQSRPNYQAPIVRGEQQLHRYQQYGSTRQSAPSFRTRLENDHHSTTFYHQPSRKKDKVTLNEDDIMQMHYGVNPSEYKSEKLRERSEESLASTTGWRSYLEQGLAESDEVAEPRAYEVIEESGSTALSSDAIGLAKQQTSADSWLPDETSSGNVIHMHKFGYEDRIVQGSRNKTPNSWAPDSYKGHEVYNEVVVDHHLSTSKFAGHNIADFATSFTTDDKNLLGSRPKVPSDRVTTETTSSHKLTKSAALLNKPVIVAEREQITTFTPEYYKQLFECFTSGHYRRVKNESLILDKKVPQQWKKKWSSLGSVTAATTVSPAANITGRPTDGKHFGPLTSEHSLLIDKRDEFVGKSDSLFFTLHAHRLVELLPEKLKMDLMAVKRVLSDCYKPNNTNDTKSSFVNCFKKITADILDTAIESDTVKLTEAVSLVKDNKTTETTDGQDRSATSRIMDEEEWLANILEKIQKLFSTHTLRVKLMNSQESEGYHVEGRRRYRHSFRRIFPVVASLYMIITSVLIPLVFQFMAMMVGKSFMVGKITLLFVLFTTFNKFLSVGIENIVPWYLQTNHASPSPPAPPAPPHVLPVPYPVPLHRYDGTQKKGNRKKDTYLYGYSYTTKRVPITYTYYTLE